jgi:hypothetical protein
MVAFWGEIPVEPGATGTRFLDTDQLLGLGWPRADAVVHVTWACADGPEVGDLSTVRLRDVSDGHRVLVDIHADRQCARLAHG